MKTDRLTINQLSPKTYEWYLTYLQAIDTKNIEVYGTFLADDCVMQSNNNPPIQGKAAILQSLSEYWITFDTLTHDLLNIYGTESSFVLEALNHYKRNDQKVITVRAVAITDRHETGLVTSVRLYTDTTPLYT
ncbi:nuclear transport factor 2 family protein [Nostoc sp. ChiSLP03a]|uniref:nuclear transport factor 2 family protein n=1 Tax=Nostoc sp. ChiSLP03a TaxID=3075380 RepID=UPI002AD1D8C1|nr:nuclear transport factor 2 family protein [Nostoc sp. ChiSLP03a]MDZ8215999.1 nuclear transport factor 2 family protein [Nostoc sp. ChiSLP03a]